MFTGIIEEMGEVISLTPTEAGSAVLTLRAGSVLEGLPNGGSLAVNGVCLTQAPEPTPGGNTTSAFPTNPAPTSLFVAHVMGETLTRTTVGGLRPGDPVNLERCPRASDRFDGHIVQGHVDGTGRVLERVDEGDWVRIRIAIPSDLAPLTAEKGSIALDGVSLTLTAVSPAPHSASTTHWVEVGLIPATLAATRMGVLQVGDEVNVEVDVIAKYAARLTQFQLPTPSVTTTSATTTAPPGPSPTTGLTTTPGPSTTPSPTINPSPTTNPSTTTSSEGDLP